MSETEGKPAEMAKARAGEPTGPHEGGLNSALTQHSRVVRAVRVHYTAGTLRGGPSLARAQVAVGPAEA